MRNDFMSMVSHELRTPLHTLYLEAQVGKLHLDRGNLATFAPDRLAAMVEHSSDVVATFNHQVTTKTFLAPEGYIAAKVLIAGLLAHQGELTPESPALSTFDADEKALREDSKTLYPQAQEVLASGV